MGPTSNSLGTASAVAAAQKDTRAKPLYALTLTKLPKGNSFAADQETPKAAMAQGAEQWLREQSHCSTREGFSPVSSGLWVG